ncbi:cytidylyl-2-hydroxypropylphosphonate hydrolase [Streptomyces sp. NPDC005134]|uniref:cytidylyl-2-hydroxypropylphosphonate hydrolase n=1 Tax=unclassified Streptomyces TaxID=2593676 RepID=UPI0033A71034
MAGTGDNARAEVDRSDVAYWAPGDHILWRYRGNGPRSPGGAHSPVHICRPVTVVQDTDELLAVWMAPGTECIRPVLADGTSVHAEPLATRYTAPRTVARSTWFGRGVLKLARPGEPWSVWLFWDRGWSFRNWYVNLEEPRTRWAGGVDSEDHFLDIAVHPDRSWRWLDEDEFTQAQRVGLMDRDTARRVREAGRAAVGVINAWGTPFRDGWENWRPDPRWQVPALPDDWDRTPSHMPS